MLSTVASRSGAISRLVLLPKHGSTNKVFVAGCSRISVYADKLPETVELPVPKIADRLETWKKANDIFYGPDRDTVNFPAKKMVESRPMVLKIIPAEWFEFYETKGGTLGPYIFTAGLFISLMSKQIIVFEHYFAEVIGFVVVAFLLERKFGKKISAYLSKTISDYDYKQFVKPVEDMKQESVKQVELVEDEMWRLEAVPLLYEAKKENVALQLEASYRDRLDQINKAFKQQLNYRVESVLARRRIQQEHMVSWISDSVMKSITPELEKQTISSCIQTLKKLSAQA